MKSFDFEQGSKTRGLEMEKVFPFWDRLFFFLTPADQSRLLLVCRRICAIGQTLAHLEHRCDCVSRAFREVRFPNQSPDRCHRLLSQIGFGWILQYIHPENLTPELCLLSVKNDPSLSLRHVPAHLQTFDLCFQSVILCSSTLRFVHVQTPELCLQAVKTNGESLEYVNWDLRTPEICLVAIASHYPSIQHVPYSLLTPEFCIAALTISRRIIPYLPRDVQSLEMWKFVLNHAEEENVIDWLNYARPDLLDSLPLEFFTACARHGRDFLLFKSRNKSFY